MELTGKNIIGASFSGEGQDSFYAVNPGSGAQLTTAFKEATASEIDKAIALAVQAFKSYRTKSGNEKAAFLDSIADEIIALGDDLIQGCMQETGLPEARLIGERGRTVNQLKLFASLLRDGSWVDARIDNADPERKPVPKPDVRSMQRALGPVGVFGASNFPLAFSVAGGDTVSALAAGCTVVVKAHPAHPGTCERVGYAIQQAVRKSGMPEGTFSMVQGKSTAVGLSLVRHPMIKAIGFTGSFRGGKALFDEAAKRSEPIPVYAEMGSTNPVFILPGILREKSETIAKDFAASVTLGVGQFCTNPGLVFLQQSDDERKFKSTLSDAIKVMDPGVMLTGDIRNNFKRGLAKLKDAKGVQVLAQAKDEKTNHDASAHILHSDVNSFLSETLLEEEVFGPSSVIISGKSKDELLLAASKLGGHLTATIHGTEDDLKNYADLIAVLEQKVGRLVINGYPTGVEVCHAMVHGGPYPSTSDSRTTSVGTLAITRFARPVCYQNFPSFLLPDELKNDNPLKIWRMVDGERRKD